MKDKEIFLMNNIYKSFIDFISFSFMLVPMTCNLFILFMRGFFKSKEDYMIENAQLRQQLSTMILAKKRPRISDNQRHFFYVLSQKWDKWKEAMVIVKPDTVIGWHNKAFKWYWKFISRPKSPNWGRPPIDPEIIKLIRQMATENNWRAVRIHGELLKLDFNVCETTVAKYLPPKNKNGGRSQTWVTFLNNFFEGITAMDFIVIPTITFKLIYVFFIIDHKRRKIIHVNTTYHPTEFWVQQQLREAFPFDNHPDYMILDNDTIFSEAVLNTMRNIGIAPKKTAIRSPWQNGIAERWVRTYKDDFLRHVIVRDEKHLLRLSKKFQEYYNNDRTHLFNGKDAPNFRETETLKTKVCKKPILNGLHHRYYRKQSA